MNRDRAMDLLRLESIKYTSAMRSQRSNFGNPIVAITLRVMIANKYCEVISLRPLYLFRRSLAGDIVKKTLAITTHQALSEADRAYWRERTPEERLDAVERYRLEAGKFLYEYPTRLRKLLEVTRDSSS